MSELISEFLPSAGAPSITGLVNWIGHHTAGMAHLVTTFTWGVELRLPTHVRHMFGDTIIRPGIMDILERVLLDKVRAAMMR